MDALHARPIGAEITEDTQCIRCGYNLRGLSKGGLCPECGTPIERSLRGDLLKYADPDWLEKLRFGASLKLWNIVLRILTGAGVGILASFVGMGQALVIATTWICGALGLWSTFLITAQEPRISLQEDTVTLRTTVRFCAVFGFLGISLRPVIGYSGMPALLGAITVTGTLVGLIAGFGVLLYLRRFAVRIPDLKLAKTTGVLMWTLPIGGGALVVYSVAMLVLSRTQAVTAAGKPAVAGGVPAAGPVTVTPATPGPAGLHALFGCGFALGALVWFLVYVLVLIKYRIAFRRAAAEARVVAAG